MPIEGIRRYGLVAALVLGCSVARAQVATVTVPGLACDNGTFAATSFVEEAAPTVSASSISLTKAFDICSPVLFQATTTGQHFSSLELSANTGLLTVKIQLTNVIFTSDRLTLQPGGGAPVENLAMEYASATVTSLVSGGAIEAPQARGILRPDAEENAAAAIAVTIGTCSFNAQSWSFSAAGGATPSLRLAILKGFDLCSPGFFTAVQKKQSFPAASLTATQNGAGSPYTTVNLTGVTITSDGLSGESAFTVVESLTLAFQDITVENNTADNSVSWNVVTNKPAN